MASFSDQLQEIKTLISSNAKSYKSFAYSTLLQLQEQCSSDTCSIQSLAQESQSVLSQIIVDIADDDEEMLVKIKFFVFFFFIFSCALRLVTEKTEKKKRKLLTMNRIGLFVFVLMTIFSFLECFVFLLFLSSQTEQ